MTRRPWGVLGALLLLAVLWPSAAVAQAGPTVSVSDATPQPGQRITVTARGFYPGSPALLYYLPEVDLGDATVGEDGTFSKAVTIPLDSFDGKKQVVVRGFAADGSPAYVTADLTMVGPPATAQLSDDELTPLEGVQVTGTRFRSRSEVALVLFPEGVLLGIASTDARQRFSLDVEMPEIVLNGLHVIVAAGLNASGGYSWLELRANMTGGVGEAPPITQSGRELIESLPPSVLSTTSTIRPTIPREQGEALEVGGEGGFNGSWVVVVVLLVLALGAMGVLVMTWVRTPEGQRWAARHRRRPRQAGGPPP
jgi:hypothetical protein